MFIIPHPRRQQREKALTLDEHFTVTLPLAR